VTLKFDKIGYWSEVKLEILRKYATAYSTILSKQPNLHHVYIDGFCGAGRHRRKGTGEFVPGSPLNALSVSPPFREFFLIDLDGDKVEYLKRQVGERPDVHFLQGDSNDVLLTQVFPKVQYPDFRRRLCLLDPYGLQLDWRVIKEAGRLKTLDLFLNFPVMDMNRNALWRNPAGVDAEDATRMTRFWGDESWKSTVYRPKRQRGLFADETEKVSNQEVAESFRKRLRQLAGFQRVPSPMPMRNDQGAIIYYLFFASQKNVAEKIGRQIFEKHKDRKA
jgi:three-Cys-motif partner protein